MSKINIIIGAQAEGKSLMAKLVYFFKSFVQDFAEAIMQENSKAELDKKILEKFTTIFPAYTWENQEFEIEYYYNSLKIKICSKILKNKIKLNIEYSEEIVKSFKAIKTEFSQSIATQSSVTTLNTFLINEVSKLFRRSNDAQNIESVFFIPAGRSFFSTLQHNIWSFLSDDIEIDYFLKEFGSTYERLKRPSGLIVKDRKTSYLHAIWYADKTFHDAKVFYANNIIKEIIRGEYHREKNTDWIYSDDQKINLAKASSGQQESLPMAIVIAELGFRSPESQGFFFIEEPEAHLFPASQKAIVDLISFIYNINNGSKGYFITTHSPYILTSFNNLIQAHNTYLSIKESEANNEKAPLKSLFKIIPEKQLLPFEDIAVFSLTNGRLKNIKDHENRLIDANEIDEISNELNRNFSSLVNLQFGDQ
ncbi:MAG: ATP-binding protein [bacterium]|nr:ATP-binding protein [bacterium]